MANFKFKFTNPALTKFFAASPKAVAWDTEARSLAAYATKAGAISLYVHLRVGSTQRKRTIGRLGELDLTSARKMAAELSVAARNGVDAIKERKRAQTAQLTFGYAYAEYMASLARKSASAATIRLCEKNHRLYLGRFEKRVLTELTRSELRAFHASLEPRGKTAANAVLRLMRTVISFAIKRLDVELATNPCIGVEWFRERGHRPSIAAADLGEFWRAIAQVENPIRQGFWRLLALSGLRKNDVATMRWEDVRDDRIHIPHPKMGKPFDVPLTRQLRDVLVDLREHGAVMYPRSPYVCPSASRLGYVQNPFDKHLAGYSPHMCRRSYAGAAAHVLKNPYLVKALLNHAVSDVTELYVVVDFAQKREAAGLVVDYLEAIIYSKGSSPAPVKFLTDQSSQVREPLPA
jgi:integrase